MHHNAAQCSTVQHWVTCTTNFKTNKKHTGDTHSSDIQVSHLTHEFDSKNLGGGVRGCAHAIWTLNTWVSNWEVCQVTSNIH
jgi:hypothetical protein